MFEFKSKTHIHFVGIGGIGMSGIADILLSMGFSVSGSDLSSNGITQSLESKGAKIYKGHEASNVGNATTLVYSSAVNNKNPEVKYALENKIPVIRRAEMLSELMKLKKGIAIAGTHGKTTTTSLVATILQYSAYDPTYIIGGIVQNLEGNAKEGKGEFLVAEADESDGSFLLLAPIVSLVTNIDMDHLDHYKSEENLYKAFIDFCNKTPFYGFNVLNLDDPGVEKIVSQINKPYVPIGIDTECANMAKNIRYKGQKTTFELWIENKCLGELEISLPGQHNVSNALGAATMAYYLGVKFENIKKGLESFGGVGRRFQTVFDENEFTIIDDYGHHPTEIKSTLKAALDAFSDREVICIFEPHRFTRTRDCWADFLHSFNQVKKTYMLPIYPASEKPIPGIDSSILAEDINKLHPGLCTNLKNYEEFFDVLSENKNKKVAIICLGAGTIGRKAFEWAKKQ